MVIVDSYGGGTDVAGTTGGVPRVVGRAEDVASGVSTVEDTVGAGVMIFVGMSAYYGCCGSSGCGIFGCSAPVGAPSCAT